MSIWKKGTDKELKPWGEVIKIGTPFGMAGKIIYMNKGQRNSLKYYKHMNQCLYCLSGKVNVIAPKEKEFGDIKDFHRGAIFNLEPGHVILIESNDPYRIEALEDSVLVEVLQGRSSNDFVMIEDDYGRI